METARKCSYVNEYMYETLNDEEAVIYDKLRQNKRVTRRRKTWQMAVQEVGGERDEREW